MKRALKVGVSNCTTTVQSMEMYDRKFRDLTNKLALDEADNETRHRLEAKKYTEVFGNY